MHILRPGQCKLKELLRKVELRVKVYFPGAQAMLNLADIIILLYQSIIFCIMIVFIFA